MTPGYAGGGESDQFLRDWNNEKTRANNYLNDHQWPPNLLLRDFSEKQLIYDALTGANPGIPNPIPWYLRIVDLGESLSVAKYFWDYGKNNDLTQQEGGYSEGDSGKTIQDGLGMVRSIREYDDYNMRFRIKDMESDL